SASTMPGFSRPGGPKRTSFMRFLFPNSGLCKGFRRLREAVFHTPFPGTASGILHARKGCGRCASLTGPRCCGHATRLKIAHGQPIKRRFRFAIRRNCGHHHAHAPGTRAELQATRGPGGDTMASLLLGAARLVYGGSTRPAQAGLVHFARHSLATVPHNVPGYKPPSMSRFCPVMKPACAEHRKAQAAPNSSGVPKRFAGTVAMRSFLACSTLMPRFFADAATLLCRRSVSKGPGSKK